MFGNILLMLYVVIQTLMSILTEYVIVKNNFYARIGRRTRLYRIIVYIGLGLLPVLGAFLPKSGFKYSCMAIGNIWLGFFMYYSGLVIFITLFLILASKLRRDNEHRLLKHALHVSFALALVITVYGLLHAQSPRIVNYELTVDKQTDSTGELKVVLIADLHLSVNSSLSTTEKMVDKVNSCDADVIVVAGDIFTSNFEGLKNPEKYSEALSKMHAKYGVYAVCGNHDVDENLFGGFAISPVSEAFRTSEMEQFFTDAGFNMLYDESVEIAGNEIVLTGRIDADKAGDGTANRMNAGELLRDVDKTKPVIVIQHEPVEYKELSESGADVVLSGHTHNGQMFPGNLVVPFFNENGYGYKRLYDIDTFVTAGVGYYGPPLRVGTNSEITVINMKFK